MKSENIQVLCFFMPFTVETFENFEDAETAERQDQKRMEPCARLELLERLRQTHYPDGKTPPRIQRVLEITDRPLGRFHGDWGLCGCHLRIQPRLKQKASPRTPPRAVAPYSLLGHGLWRRRPACEL